MKPSFALNSEPRPGNYPSHNLSSANNETAGNLICSPFGACEPCPPDAVCPLVFWRFISCWSTCRIQLNQPFCRPFGNRRLVHCVNGTDIHTTSTSLSHSTTVHTNDHERHDTNPHNPPFTHEPLEHPDGEILAWESCGRIIPKERADFYEFVACNFVFAIVSLGVLFFSSRRLQVMQARQLAARIGLFREDERVTRIWKFRHFLIVSGLIMVHVLVQ